MTEKKNSRFSRWFYGEEDPLLGKVEMKPQKEYKEEEASVRKGCGNTGSFRKRFMIWSIIRSSCCLIRLTG